MIEILDDGQDWPIALPEEDDALLDRDLEARRADGVACARWSYEDGDGWTCIVGQPTGSGVGSEGGSEFYEEIVAGCMFNGWRLFSTPREEAGS